ncbi:hypothetical protein C6372_02395 [Bacillus halotolerans]|nr:hypothetical protein C6372_02395 [Bacillus halotolerans]
MTTVQFLQVLAPIALKVVADRYFKKKDTNESKDIAVSKVCLCQQTRRMISPNKRYKRNIRPNRRFKRKR